MANTTIAIGRREPTVQGSLGADKPGQLLPGDYLLRCDTQGFQVEPTSFSIFGRVDPDVSLMRTTKRLFPNVNVARIVFVECPYTCVGEREAHNRFRGSPRFITSEVEITLEPVAQPLDFTFTCNFFTDTGRLIGRSRRRIEVPKGERSYRMREGWGNADGNYWRNGVYYAECDADGKFMGSSYFEVERR